MNLWSISIALYLRTGLSFPSTFTKESYSNGHFYLGGQIKLKLDDNISKEHIESIQNKNIERNQHDYANYWEYSSCMSHEKTFNAFVKLFYFFEDNKGTLFS